MGKEVGSTAVGVHERSQRSSLVGVLATAALPVAVFFVFGDLRIAGIVLLAAFWFADSYSADMPPEWRYSACRIYLPVFFCYNAISVLSPNLYNRGLIAWSLLLGGISFLIGWMIFAPKRDHLGAVRPTERLKVEFNTPLLFSIVGVTVLVYVALAMRAGILPAFSDNPSLTRTQFFPSGYIASIIVVGVHLTSFVGIIWFITDRARRWQGAGLAVLGLFMGYGTGNRGIIFIPLLLAGLVIGYCWKLNISRAIPWVIFAISAFSVLGYSRGVRSHGQRVYVEYLQSKGFSGLGEYFAPILSYIYATAETFDRTSRIIPDSVDFAWGRQFFSPLLLHRSVDLYLKDILGDTFSGFGLATGGLNAFYIDWGVPGIIVGFLFMGGAAAILFRKAVDTRSPRMVVMYCYLLAFLFLSNYGHPFAYLYYIVEPVLLYFLILGQRVNSVDRPRYTKLTL